MLIVTKTNINQESIDYRLQQLYIEELKKDIAKKLEENGFEMDKCDIDAELRASSENPGIHKINLSIHPKRSGIEAVKIDIGNNVQEAMSQEVEKIKEILAKEYEIDPESISIK